MKPHPKSGSVTIGTKPAESMWAEMDKIYNANPEPMGEGWFTVEQFALRYGLSRNWVATRLRGDNRLEKWKGMQGHPARVKIKYRIRPWQIIQDLPQTGLPTNTIPRIRPTP